MQLPPAEHETQLPSLQTLFVPQEVPLATVPVSAQTEAPVTQEVVPVRHGFVGWHCAPDVHDTHMPALQTLFIPHSVPLARFLPVSEQVMVGAQTVMPAWQALPLGVQAIPAVQETQLPSLQTMLVPQEVPLVKFPDSVQTGTPVPQAIAPVRQGLPLTVQLAPAWQATQLPLLLQTLSVPQLVPAATGVVLSVQTGAPVEHESDPWWQALAGTQAAPCWQAPHWPSRQTMPVPQELPFGWLPDSTQTDVPVAQEVVPLRQGLPATVQATPAVQGTQAPPLQTMFWPQTVPLAWACCVSVQLATVPEQVTLPS